MIEITEEESETMNLAIDIYGVHNQVEKCIEEMAELTQALIKWHQDPYGDKKANHVAEEIADVRIMIEQMTMIFDEGCVGAWISKKTKRLANRLHKEV